MKTRITSVVTRRSRYDLLQDVRTDKVLFVRQHEGGTDTGLPQGTWLPVAVCSPALDAMERLHLTAIVDGDGGQLSIRTGIILTTVPTVQTVTLADVDAG